MENEKNLKENAPKEIITYHPKQDWWITILEFVIIMLLGLIVIAVILFSVYFIIWGGDRELEKVKNICRVASFLGGNWKAALLILIPLFFRPIRFFLERVKKAWNLDTEEPQKPSASDMVTPAPSKPKKERGG